MRADIARLTALIPSGARPKVFYEIDATSTIYGLAPDDYAAELITLAGGEPVTSGSAGVYEIALETLVAAAPQVILLGDAAYGTTAARWRPDPAGRRSLRLRAVRSAPSMAIS